MKNLLKFLITTCISFSFACTHVNQDVSDENDKTQSVTPVTITRITREPMATYITLNATSSFLKKSLLKSPSAGFITEMKITPGDHVQTGQTLFMLQTKESAAYHDLHIQDNLPDYNGFIPVKAGANGVAVNLPHAKGDYVQEGDELCTLAEQSSLIFLLDVPYEFHPFVRLNEECTIDLTDGKSLKGKIESQLAAMDIAAQTQRFIIRPLTIDLLPENLVASISIMKSKKENAFTLPKEAILANETQTEFWVMKLESDSVAIKVPVHPGIQQKKSVEILDPQFSEEDRFVLSGGYGLQEKARIVITGQTP